MAGQASIDNSGNGIATSTMGCGLFKAVKLCPD